MNFELFGNVVNHYREYLLVFSFETKTEEKTEK